MAQLLKADTQVVVAIGPFVSIADGFTLINTFENSAADDLVLIKHGATTGVDISGRTDAAYGAYVAPGMVYLTLTTDDTDTEGNLTIIAEDVNLCLPVVNRFQVISQAAFNSLHTTDASGLMTVDVATIAANAITNLSLIHI